MHRVPRILLGIGVGLAVVIAALAVTLPAGARRVVPFPGAASAGGPAPTIVRGVYHVHTTRSDGSGTVDAVLAAAARAGLQFVLFTDHGDGTRALPPPMFRYGVLAIDGVEISTTGGHYVALGLPRTPYRLAGEPRDVVEDVARFGGFGIAAHPDSPKAELAWTAWNEPFDGLEWLNLDTEWRDESRARLLWGLAQHLVRPAETVAALVAHTSGNLAHWDDLARDRRVVGLAAVDAHARVGGEDAFASSGPLSLAVPSYETSFRTVRLNVELPAPLLGVPAGRAADDAARVLAAVRAGRVFNSLDALAPVGRLDFAAASSGVRARMGGLLRPSRSIAWTAAADAPAGAELRLVCDGRVVAIGSTAERLTHLMNDTRRPASCRLEVGWDAHGAWTRWIVTNPIYLRASDGPVAGGRTTAPRVLTEMDTLGDPVRGASWIVEHDSQSTATVTSAGAGVAQQVTFTFALRPGSRTSQFAAFATSDVEALAYFSSLAYTIRADRPMRISVQVREPLPDRGARRWRRSFYCDQTPREMVIDIDDMAPVPPSIEAQPRSRALKSLLFVVDTEHTQPGVSGTIWLERLRAGR